MSRIKVIDHHNANPEQQALLDAIQSQLGMVPNFLKVLANSPVALRAFPGLHEIAGSGSLVPQTRERIALALAEHNGEVTTAEIVEARNAGYSEAEIVEIITHVGMNILTNIIGKASRVEIDFPKIELKLAG